MSFAGMASTPSGCRSNDTTASRWRRCCRRATPAPTARRTTPSCSAGRSRSCRLSTATRRSHGRDRAHYADDFVAMAAGARADAEALWDEVAALLAPMGLRLSEQKTRICHIDEGFDSLGWHIQRRSSRGRAGKKAVYTYPSKKALASVMAKVRSLTCRSKHRTLADLLRSVDRVLQGWCDYFRHGVSSPTFSYLDYFTWWRIFGWLRKRHAELNRANLVRERGSELLRGPPRLPGADAARVGSCP